MSKNKIFISGSLAFALGVLLGSALEIPTPWLYLTMAFLVAAFALSYRWGLRNNDLAVAIFCLFCLTVGVWRLQAAQQPNEYQSILGSKQELNGLIVSDIDVRRDKQLFAFRPAGYEQNLLITTTKTTTYFYGDRLLLADKIEEIKNFSDFDYKGYLEKDNIFALARYPKLIILQNKKGNPVIYWLLRTKRLLEQQIARVLREPQNSLALGLLIGARRGLPQEVTDNFLATGTSHIVAISGYNISVIVGALTFLAHFLGRKLSFWFSLAAIFAFVIMAGASSSVIRASVMGALLLLAFRLGRLYRISTALCAAGTVMLVVNPKVLYWDVGFQLSFLATIGIVYLVPLLDQLTPRWPNPGQVKLLLFTTLAAIVATLPLVLLEFGRISLVAPLANLLILPAVPPAMLFGFLTAVPGLGYGFGLIANLVLTYILRTTELLARLPYSSVEWPISPAIFTAIALGFVCLYAWVYLWLERRVAGQKTIKQAPHYYVDTHP